MVSTTPIDLCLYFIPTLLKMIWEVVYSQRTSNDRYRPRGWFYIHLYCMNNTALENEMT